MIDIIIPIWQWIMENRFQMTQFVYNWWKWRVSQIIPVTDEMRKESILSEIKRRYL